MLELVDPSKVRCFGPGLEIGVRAHVPQTFTVDSSKAGLAPLLVQLYGPTGKALADVWLMINWEKINKKKSNLWKSFGKAWNYRTTFSVFCY